MTCHYVVQVINITVDLSTGDTLEDLGYNGLWTGARDCKWTHAQRNIHWFKDIQAQTEIILSFATVKGFCTKSCTIQRSHKLVLLQEEVKEEKNDSSDSFQCVPRANLNKNYKLRVWRMMWAITRQRDSIKLHFVLLNTLYAYRLCYICCCFHFFICHQFIAIFGATK